MKPYYEGGGVEIYHGDCIPILREMAADSVNCCVTSPPYFGLRDYGTGKWSGGLPDCDHTYQHGVQGAAGQRATRTFTAQNVYKDECQRCGAVRVDEQIGLERTWPEYVAKLVEVFREVRRVLRADGTCWINLGDSYATGAGAVGECPGGGEQGERWKDGYRGTRGDSPKHAAKAVGPMTSGEPTVAARPETEGSDDDPGARGDCATG